MTYTYMMISKNTDKSWVLVRWLCLLHAPADQFAAKYD